VRSSSDEAARDVALETIRRDAPAIDPQAVGDRLFHALFADEVERLLDRSLAKIEGEERGLRLRLRLAPDQEGLARLAGLPWEVLWGGRYGFLSLSWKTPLVRLLEISRAANRVPLEPPLRILAVVSRAGSPPLNVDQERRNLQQACAGLSGVKVVFPTEATADALRRALHDGPVHVLHFMGHGTFHQVTGEGALLFEKEGGKPDFVQASALAALVRDFPTLRLVFLTACDSARMTQEEGLDAFGGVASALLLAGVPAVLAMQYRISDRAAILFSEAFYRRLAAGDPVDAATTEGRMAVHLRDRGSVEWATPVLFSRVPDGLLFEPKPLVPEAIRSRIHDFSRLVADKTEGFVGRRWLFESIDGFARENPRGYFVLRGDPGIGKSALIARMVKDRDHVHHFNLRADGIQRPETFLGNVCAQLTARYSLGLSFLPPEATQDSRFLSSLLEKAAARLPPEGKLFVLVDALDESDRTGLPPGANALFLPTTLPQGVYMVVTTRRGGSLLRIDCEQQVLDLEQDSAGNVADVREFVESKLPLPGIRTYLATQALDDETFVVEMVDKSQGNFMYLRYVLPEIERGAYQDRSFDTLPVGLQNYYQDHWGRMRTRDENAWFEFQLPVLVALTVVKEPVSIDLIEDFAGVKDRKRIWTVLQEWDQFLYTKQERDDAGQPQKRYRLYHESFHDFIAAKDEVADERVTLKGAHARISEVLWQDLYGEG
jgi:hypothetical protein